jgi:hypothetical protein
MRQVITVFVLLLFVSCSKMEFQTPPESSVMTAYIDQNLWSADSLTEAYYYHNYLFISAKGGNENIILKIENPVIGDNSNVDVEYRSLATNEVSKTKSSHINLYLDVLDTVNAQPSVINGTFNGQFEVNNGRTIKIQEGKIKNAVTKSLFCENTIRSVLSTNVKIGGQWELVRIINRHNSSIQNPTCQNKILMNFYDEDYMPKGKTATDNSFEIDGPENSILGDFTILDANKISFIPAKKTNNETTKYNEDFENLIFESITGSTTFYISNSLMHLESKDYVAVFYRHS